MLEEYLQQQFLEGDHDSQGCFKILREKAQQRWAESGLDNAEKALLRLVQVGVNSGAQEISVQLGRDSVTLWFRNIKRGALASANIQEELMTILLACLQVGFQQITFSNSTGTSLLTRDSFSPAARQRILSGCVSIHLVRKPEGGFWQRLRYNLARRASEFQSLHQNLSFGPCCISIDNLEQRPVPPNCGLRALELFLMGPNGLKPWGVRPHFAMSPAAIVLTSRQAEAPLRAKNERDWECFARLRVNADRDFFEPSLLGWKSRTFSFSTILGQLFIPREPSDDRQVHIIKDGVLVQSTPGPWGGRVGGVVSGAGLDTDLSNLKVVKNRKYESFLDYLNNEIRAASKRVQRPARLDPRLQRAFEFIPS